LNLVALLAVVHGAFSRGPFGLHAAYRREVRRGLTEEAAPLLVTEADLDPLPAPIQRYLRFAGVVGQPRVKNYRMRFIGYGDGGRPGLRTRDVLALHGRAVSA
jgi:uncharacterized protein DUF6544